MNPVVLWCHTCGIDFHFRAEPELAKCARCLSVLRRDSPASPTAVKHDTGKSRLDLLPFDALEEIGAVFGHGAEKYAAHNWARGMAWGRLVAAMLRHVSAWMRGVERDEESGHHHLAHAACCVLMLLALVLRQVGTDDRGLDMRPKQPERAP